MVLTNPIMTVLMTVLNNSNYNHIWALKGLIIGL